MNTLKEIEIFPYQRGNSLFIDSQHHHTTVEDHKRLINIIEHIASKSGGQVTAESIAYECDLDSEDAAIQFIYRHLKELDLIDGTKQGPFSLQSQLTQIIIKNYQKNRIKSNIITIQNICDPESLLITTDKLLTLGKIDSAIQILETLDFAKLHPDISGRVFGRIADLLSIKGEYTRSIKFANKGLLEIEKRGTKARVLISFLHEIAARSYYYMGGKKNIYKALHHINESLDCWNTRTLKHDARRAEQLALQARIISAIPDQNHDIITRHFDATYSVIKNENCNNEHEYAYLFNLTDYNKLCYYLSCIQQDELRPLFEDKCGQLISYMCDNDQYRYTPSEWFDLKEAECIFNYYTMNNNREMIINSTAEALDFAKQANLHGPRIQYIRQIFKKFNGKSDDLERAKNSNKRLVSLTALAHYLHCPMCLEITGNHRI